ncbi:ABC transporter permease [Streptomyces sp. H27-C3]|uniref:ABC transporter permease n=1 Tax=Streptomyces sp. H27-C3 TaxID=3046305 RepID=UPI0024BBB780|nr:ABC transporter permease [Streptomyces sp. H27-C3]MDJ0463503.1 ABC transporter permease [Streptomyces sp. H27-C3]
MSTVTTMDPAGTKGGSSRVRTTATGRVAALTRAELTLLVRHKAVLFTALVLPVGLTFAMRPVFDDMDLEKAGLTMGSAVMPMAVAFVLLFGVYSALVTVFVVRREELVLKRLRTGEPGDTEILTGTAVATIAAGIVQCVVLVVAGAAVLGMEMPENPLLVVAGILLGMVLSGTLAAATTILTRSAEGSQLTIMPMMLVSMAGSGVVVPLEMLPDKLASICELLPLSPIVELVRGGWTGQLGAYEALGAVATAVAWTVLSGFAVQKWFRWEPRR